MFSFFFDLHQLLLHLLARSTFHGIDGARQHFESLLGEDVVDLSVLHADVIRKDLLALVRLATDHTSQVVPEVSAPEI